MGGDGGCVQSRVDMTRTVGYDFLDKTNAQPSTVGFVGVAKVDPQKQRRIRMSSCRLSNAPLENPVVACRMGNLYNKEFVLSLLLEKKLPESLGHVRALKDLKDCKVKFVEDAEKGDKEKNSIVCPLIGESLNDGGTKSVVSWGCGCVMSLRGMENTQKYGEKGIEKLEKFECPVCSFTLEGNERIKANTIYLAPMEDEEKLLKERLPKRKGKKDKRKEKGGDDFFSKVLDIAGSGNSNLALGGASSSSGANNASSSSSPQKNRENNSPRGSSEERNAKRRRTADYELIGGRYHAKTEAVNDDDDKFKGKSAAFKSLFHNSSSRGISGARDGFGAPPRG